MAFVVLLLLASPLVGSLGGVLFRRLPEGRPVVLARSECERCRAVLGPAELVPVLSFLVQRGRCRRCGAPIGPDHLLFELLAPAVAAVTVVALGADAPHPVLLSGTVLGWFAVLLAAIDLRCFLLPDVLTLPLLILGLLATVLAPSGWVPDAPGRHAAAAAGAYALFRLIAGGYRRLRGRNGLGQGDAKLFAAAGAWLGPEPLPLLLLAAALGTLALALLLGRGRVSSRAPVPFGPGLALCCWLFWLAGAANALP